MPTSDKPTPWYLAAPIHGILLVGSIFFVLPLVWMIVTSFKPLEQTLKVPESVKEAFVGVGYRAKIDGRVYDVVLENGNVVSVASSHFFMVASGNGKSTVAA